MTFLEDLKKSPAYCFTSDIEWANESVIKYAFKFFDKFNVPVTPFITHRSEEITRRYAGKERLVGVHPNFFSDSTHGTTYQEVVNHVIALNPRARGFRSHSCFVNLKIEDIFYDRNYKWDSNLVLHLQPDIVPLHLATGLTRFPNFLEDYHFLRLQSGTVNCAVHLKKIKPKLSTAGLKIFNFHPIHIFLNTTSLEQYMNYKSGKTSMKDEDGIKNIVENIIDYVKSNTGLGIFYLDDIYEIVSKDGGNRYIEHNKHWRRVC